MEQDFHLYSGIALQEFKYGTRDGSFLACLKGEERPKAKRDDREPLVKTEVHEVILPKLDAETWKDDGLFIGRGEDFEGLELCIGNDVR